LVSLGFKFFDGFFFTDYVFSYKIGRIVLVLNGRHAGKKGIIIENTSQSTGISSNNIIVLGIKNFPKQINRKQINKVLKKKSNIKVFFKTLNKNHILPTRYFVDLGTDQQELISKVSCNLLKLKSNEKYFVDTTTELNWQVNNIFIDKYFSGKNKWFFKKLKF